METGMVDAMKIEFRPATEADLADLVRMLAQDPLGKSRENPQMPIEENYVQAFTDIDNDPNNLLLVAHMGEVVVGMLQLTFIPYLTHRGSWRCLIEGVRIKHTYRGQGLGTIMFGHAIETARSKGCSIVQLTSDKKRPEAIQFYRQIGFKDTHEGFKMAL